MAERVWRCTSDGGQGIDTPEGTRGFTPCEHCTLIDVADGHEAIVRTPWIDEQGFRRSSVPNHPNYAGTRWEGVQQDLCTHLAIPHDAVETTIGEVLSILEEQGYKITLRKSRR